MKHSYKTKNETTALKRHALFHAEVERSFVEAKVLLKNIVPAKQETKYQTPSKQFIEVYEQLKGNGLLPHQISTVDATMSERERLAWATDDLRYSEAVVLYEADAISGQEFEDLTKSLKYEPFKRFARQRDYIRYLEDEAEIRDGDSADKIKIALNILRGDYKGPEPNLEDLFNHYVDVKRSEARQGERNQRQQIKLENSIKRILDLVASAHSDGKETLITDLDMTAIKNAFEDKYFRIDTRRRNYSDASAAVNLWNNYNPKKPIHNPFFELRKALPKKDSKQRERRVWTPEEYQRFWAAIRNETDPSRKLMCMFMAYAGKPQLEVAGLTRDEVRMDYEVPHVLFKSNEHRVLGKKRQENMLPLVGEILEVMREYVSTFDGDSKDLLFPDLYKMDSGSRSKVVGKYAEELNPIEGTLFVPYGLRHTFKPRYEEAGVDAILGMYLFGHKNKLTSKTHDGYARGLNRLEKIKSLRDHMLRIMEVTYWDYDYRISDDLS